MEHLQSYMCKIDAHKHFWDDSNNHITNVVLEKPEKL